MTNENDLYIDSFIHQLKKQIENIDVTVNELLKSHTSFQIGGPCDYFIRPKSVEELKLSIKICQIHHIPIFILGNGSNLLVTDKGFRGAVIQVSKNLSNCRVINHRLVAEAGILLSTLANIGMRHSLCGLEFASGIPGTLGGAVYMNAGAYGGEIKQVVKSVVGMDYQGNLRTFNEEELDFGYRHSRFQIDDYIIVEIEIELAKGNIEQIKSRMKEYNGQRKEKQPLEYASAGSTFKRPEGFYAGKLIMEAGLQGYSVGDACVSEKHCGFIVNKGNATYAQIESLIEYVQEVVYQKFGVKLEREIKILGQY